MTPLTDQQPKISRSDFIFIDDCSNPYRVCQSESSGEYWLYYWNKGSKSWVSKRKVTHDEVSNFWDIKIKDEWHHLYEGGVKFK